MIKSALLSAVAVFSFANFAHASTLDVVLGNSSNTIASYGTTGALSADIDLSTVSLTGSAGFLPANVGLAGVAAPPSGLTPTQSYVYVPAGNNSAATFSLAANNFGLTWGSIDSYNTLTVTDTLGNSYAITGTDILNNLAAGTGQSDVVITDPFAKIVSAVLTSADNSFEAANFSTQSAVPLPTTAVLFGFALVGLTLLARRKEGSV